MLFVIMFIKIRLNYISMRGVWFRVLCGEQHKRNNARDEDSLLLYRDSRWSYVDRACGIFLSCTILRAKLQKKSEICKKIVKKTHLKMRRVH